MFSVIVNTLAVFLCGAFGAMLKKYKSDRINDAAMTALGLAIVVVGVIDLFEIQNVLVLVLSVVLGGILGEILHIEDGLERFGNFLQKKMTKPKYDENGNPLPNTFGEGVISATILFCVDAQVIFGSIMAGMGEHEILLTKSILDGTIAFFLAMKLGYGVTLSAIPVFVLQSVFALLANSLSGYLTTAFLGELTALGGVFMLCIGINLLGIKKIKTANFLPALLGSLVMFWI
ncbi:MAG: DUF554 domain-containing protein [Clostridia bacterium]|nr:DUF554 domain-containing protein [Clostridia bacterium]